MSEKVKGKFARFYKLRYSRFNIFDACFTTLIVLLFITLLRPASVRSEHNLDGCGSHNISPDSPDRVGRWSPPGHRPAENDQPVRTDNDTKNPLNKAGGVVGRAITRPPLYLGAEDWLDDLIEKLWIIESGRRLNPPEGDNGLAVGALQLHKCAVDDVNRHYQTNFSYADRRDFPKARLIARLYIQMWLDVHKEEICSRIFNGGPRGWRKKSTDGYWKRIQKLATEDTESTENLK